MRLHFLLSTGLLWAASLGAQTPSQLDPTVLSTQRSAWGFDTSGMDRSLLPGNDFYGYANGEWNQRAQIPADRTSVGSFSDLRYNANLRIRGLLEQTPNRAGLSASAQKAGLLYRTFLDEAAVAKLGDTPLRSDLSRLSRIQSKAGLAAAMGASFGGFGASLFNLDISYDDRDPAHYAVHLGQAGLGMPSRDYYLQPQFRQTRLAYEAYIAQLLLLAGQPNSQSEAHAIALFETRIAEVSWTHAQERDPVKTYNPETVSQLKRSDPQFAWSAFFDAAGLHNIDHVIVTTSGSVPQLAHIFATTPLRTLKAWQAFHTIDAAAPYLPDAYVQAHFLFRLHTLGGQPTLAPRWSRAVGFANEAMGSAVGELYVQQYFPEANQRLMNELVDSLRAALKDRLEHLSWMSDSTKREALHKLANLEVQIGRPRAWIDYGSLKVARGDLYGDAQRAKAFDWNRRVSELSGPWNKSDWRFWPQYPTAYTENNQLIFTAAMLQAPFFDPGADPAVNYGGIGAVIGHELTHSFDDQGRETDADNRLRNWWTPEDAAQFKSRADRLSLQYSEVEPLPGVHIRGDVTLGENIADLGGVTIAFQAYHSSLLGNGAPMLDGFTGDQRFFLGWAQIWREKHRDEDLRKLVLTDVHSPGTARVNAVVRNVDSLYVSFHVQPGQTLFLPPDQRVRIW